MQSSAPTSSPPALPIAVDPLLRHFPTHVQACYVRLRETSDPLAGDTLVLAIVADHMRDKLAPLHDASALMADLGFDSVTIAEMVFFLEDLLKVSVTNAEIIRVRTVGELRAFVRVKLAQQKPVGNPAP